MPNQPILRIAVPAPLYTCFDYLPPADIDPATLPCGIRLRVPFGRGERIGVLVDRVSSSSFDTSALKSATAVLDREPLLAEQDLKLLLWAAAYYQHPPGEVIAAALPVRLRKGEKAVKLGITGWRLTASKESTPPTRAPRQLKIIQTLAEHPEGIAQQALYALCGNCRPILRTLEEKGWVEPCELKPQHIPTTLDAPKPILNPAQREAITAVSASLQTFNTFLLNGVTGSGKTEVYLGLMEEALAANRQVLILVPEIALTPQLMQRFQSRISSPIALLHSGLTDREREQAWLSASQGEAAVILGTRSAVFTPAPRLGLIIIDEEHDLSFKQQDGFRYSARDLAIVRAQHQGFPVLLGSATPSLESLHNAATGRYQRVDLPERAGDAKPPRIDLLDIRSAPLNGGISPALLRMLGEELTAGNQVLLFLNRRGYAPVVICHHCGWLSECPRCDARMTLHLGTQMLWCHHCGHQRRLYRTCPECDGSDLRPLGQGTEQLEEVLSQQFPNHSIARIDRDSTRRKGALEKMLNAVHAGQHHILLGTQMLAKGHHFPDVTLVGILDVDQGLFSADYRAAERMAQLVEQVAGRAGRATKPGRVLVQTRHPDHPLLQTLVHQGYNTFAQVCLNERSQAHLPPFSYQALLRAEATSSEKPIRFLEEAAQQAKTINTQDVELWGPVPAPMERRAGRVRAHLLIQANHRSTLHKLLSQLIPSLGRLKSARNVRWSIDVDPQEML